jgi:asparagine synthase (glutamine-hydrolysing)
MSVQFGRWNLEGRPPARDYIEKVCTILAPYGPDSNESYAEGGVKILYRAFHTTKESHRETQPHISTSGVVITWDGRLDNRAELIGELRDAVTKNSTDLAIVAAAYENWGMPCFARLIGDWGLSIWNPINRSLILATDAVGAKHLYYSFQTDHVTWSTILDPLVLFADKAFTICEEYVAGWFSHFPAPHLTPYVGIHAVPPSSSVLLQVTTHGTKQIITKYWDFNPSRRIRYRSDAEYEEHFRVVFAEAVRRRLRSDRPVLAELSGGMDSSSVVCMADTIIAHGHADCPRLDTISWFDQSQPATDELPFFTKVEEKRKCKGYHIDLRELRANQVDPRNAFEYDDDRFAATPCHSHLSNFSRVYAEHMKSQGYRVTLSGVFGESATGGGVPTPMLEFQNLLARARLFTLAHQLSAWAAKMRKHWLPLLLEAARGFFISAAAYAPNGTSLAPWFDTGFVRRNRTALCGYPKRTRLFGPLPSFQHNVGKFAGERRLTAYLCLELGQLREIRWPYLDRDLREFMYAVPWEQIVGVGKRRFLMRRALVGIVPDELLSRKQQGFIRQEPPRDLPSLAEMDSYMVTDSLRILDQNRFVAALQKPRHHEEACIGALTCALGLEYWLRHLEHQGVLKRSIPTRETVSPPVLRSSNSKDQLNQKV